MKMKKGRKLDRGTHSKFYYVDPPLHRVICDHEVSTSSGRIGDSAKSVAKHDSATEMNHCSQHSVLQLKNLGFLLDWRFWWLVNLLCSLLAGEI